MENVWRRWELFTNEAINKLATAELETVELVVHMAGTTNTV